MPRNVDKKLLEATLYTLGDLLHDEVTCFVVGGARDVLISGKGTTKDLDIKCNVGNTFSLLNQVGSRPQVWMFYLGEFVNKEGRFCRHGIDIRAYMDSYVTVDVFTSDNEPENPRRLNKYRNLIVCIDGDYHEAGS